MLCASAGIEAVPDLSSLLEQFEKSEGEETLSVDVLLGPAL